MSPVNHFVRVGKVEPHDPPPLVLGKVLLSCGWVIVDDRPCPFAVEERLLKDEAAGEVADLRPEFILPVFLLEPQVLGDERHWCVLETNSGAAAVDES